MINFSFDWTNCFKYSIFHESLENEIIPLIMVLKKFARTNRGNRSLRSVLARKLVNFKIKFGMIETEELPAADEDTKDGNHNNNDLDDRNLGLNQDGDNNSRINASNIYQDSLYRDADMTLSFAYAARLPSQQDPLLSAETTRNASPFKHMTKASDGSDTMTGGPQNPLSLTLIKGKTQPQTPLLDTAGGARLSTASMSRRKFVAQQQQ